MSSTADLDVVVYGATGFTGRLIAEYLNGIAGDEAISWAMAGRNPDKLAEVRSELGIDPGVELLVADATDESALRAMAERATVVIAAAGPYAQYGTAVVKACAETGTDYVDLCGEPNWIRPMIDQFDETAKSTGARLVFSSGFDSIPSDLGIYLLQKEAIARSGQPISRVKGRVKAMAGGASGGTVASLGSTMAIAAGNPEVAELLKNPFALTPGFEGPKQPSGMKPVLDDDLGSWASPFVMAPINTKTVHRTNFMLGHRYGEDFVYDEMVATGPGEDGEAMAIQMAKTGGMDMSGDLPAPGEGPSKEERDAGHYTIDYSGDLPDAQRLTVTVSGFQDPGYGSTSKMISHAALTLIADAADSPAGANTPGGVMGDQLIERLSSRGILSFEVTAG